MDNNEEKKFSKKDWFIVIFVTFIVVVAMIGIIVPIALIEEEKQNPTTYCELGEVAQYDDLNITINSYVFSDYIADIEGGQEADEGFKYVVVYLTVTNTGSKTKMLGGGYNFNLVYDGTYEYNAVFKMYNEFFQAHDDIKPLETITCCTNFEVPIEIETNADKKLELKLQKNKISVEENVRWILRDTIL